MIALEFVDNFATVFGSERAPYAVDALALGGGRRIDAARVDRFADEADRCVTHGCVDSAGVVACGRVDHSSGTVVVGQLGATGAVGREDGVEADVRHGSVGPSRPRPISYRNARSEDIGIVGVDLGVARTGAARDCSGPHVVGSALSDDPAVLGDEMLRQHDRIACAVGDTEKLMTPLILLNMPRGLLLSLFWLLGIESPQLNT